MNSSKRLLAFNILFVASAIVLINSARAYSTASVQTSSRNKISPSDCYSKHKNSSHLVEEFSFVIKDFKIFHQAEKNNLNITLRYRYVTYITDTQYPDFRLIARDVENFLISYPSNKDFWEVLNKKITLLVLEKYPSVVWITSEMQVSPSSLDPYLRSSVVTRERMLRVPNKKSCKHHKIAYISYCEGFRLARMDPAGGMRVSRGTEGLVPYRPGCS